MEYIEGCDCPTCVEYKVLKREYNKAINDQYGNSVMKPDWPSAATSYLFLSASDAEYFSGTSANTIIADYVSALSTSTPNIPKEKEDTTMLLNSQTPIEISQRNYLSDRIYTVRCDAMELLSKKFNMIDDRPPQTFKDLKERLTKGLYVFVKNGKPIDDEDLLEDDDNEDDDYGSPRDFWEFSEVIAWRDPSKKRDKAGYSEKVQQLDKDSATLKDLIVIKSATEGYEAFEAFKTKWTQ